MKSKDLFAKQMMVEMSHVFVEQPWPGPLVQMVYTMEAGSFPLKHGYLSINPGYSF